MNPSVSIYTDGSCLGNPGPGGWAAILVCGDREREVWGACAESTTNQRMEMAAAIEGLRVLPRKCAVKLFTDSKYVQRGMSEWLPGWKRNGRLMAGDMANADLWVVLDRISQRHDIDWIWVRGHAGDYFNERVNAMAQQAARSAQATSTFGN